MGLYDFLRAQGVLTNPSAPMQNASMAAPNPNARFLPPDAEYEMALADQQQMAANPMQQAMAAPEVPTWVRALEAAGRGLSIAGSQDPMKAFTQFSTMDTEEAERVRKAQIEQAQLKQNARKLSLEELKANKPVIQSSGVPGFSIAIYPDGRVENIVNDSAVEAYNKSEEAKNTRQQATFENQNQMLDKRLASSERIAADRQAAADRKGARLNPSLQKEEDADFGMIDGAKAAASDIQPVIDNLTTGKLNLGALSNAANAARNFFGRSTEESQAYAELQRGITRITNESLRLNKGVQTEGDAQRAAKEVLAAFANNDTALMTKSLQDLQRINLRAAENKARMIDRRRTSQGVEPIFGGQAASTPQPSNNNNDPLGLRR
jgi:hypothetical protein